jgi:hypothetical protein
MFSWLNRLRYSEFWAAAEQCQGRARSRQGAGHKACLDSVDNAGLQVQKEGTWDVVLVVRLVEKHVLPVPGALCGVLFQHAVLADAVLQAQLGAARTGVRAGAPPAWGLVFEAGPRATHAPVAKTRSLSGCRTGQPAT